MKYFQVDEGYSRTPSNYMKVIYCKKRINLKE